MSDIHSVAMAKDVYARMTDRVTTEATAVFGRRWEHAVSECQPLFRDMDVAAVTSCLIPDFAILRHQEEMLLTGEARGRIVSQFTTCHVIHRNVEAQFCECIRLARRTLSQGLLDVILVDSRRRIEQGMELRRQVRQLLDTGSAMVDDIEAQVRAGKPAYLEEAVTDGFSYMTAVLTRGLHTNQF